VGDEGKDVSKAQSQKKNSRVRAKENERDIEAVRNGHVNA
jgi:hypothetical protein